MNRYRMLAAIGALSLLGVSCGSDDDDTTATTGAAVTTTAAASTTAAEATSAPATTTADTAGADTTMEMTETTDTTETTETTETMGSTPSTGSSVGGEFAELCALAEEIASQEQPPSNEQLVQYQELAPEEIEDDVDAFVEALLPAEGDMVAFFNVVAEDENEAHSDAIDAWEEENCGIPHSEQDALPPGASQEIEDDAARVDVTGVDYEFQFETPTEAGRTSFVFTNEGEEAHFLLVVKLAEGVTLQQALESDDSEGMIEGQWETRLAAGGGDEEAITFDLEPGNYGMACFIPGPDGTPHAFLGMVSEFTVAAG